MNTETIDVLLNTIKAILNNGSCTVEKPEEVMWDELADFVKFHEITGLVSGRFAAMDGVPDAVKNKFAEYEMTNIFREANQELEVKNILAAFDDKGFDCMPLKGFIIKNLYPSVEMRDMCDVDILIREKDIDELGKIMEENGFVFKNESRHEFIYQSKITTVELHKSLVPVYNKDLYSYYGDGWKLAKKRSEESHIYEMTAEDFYIYSVVHTAKHYLNGGTGIKQVVDEYVLNHTREYSERDNEYVTAELKKLGLVRFEENLKRLSEVWFGCAGHTENTADMASYILNSGAWGTKERSELSTFYRESAEGDFAKARLKVVMHRIFPNMVEMRNRYPVLRKHPYLYPVMVLVRLVEAVLFRRKGLRNNAELLSRSDNEELESFAKHCKAVGLKSTL